MGKNKLDAVNFCKLFDESTLEKYLYKDEAKEEYAKRLKEE